MDAKLLLLAAAVATLVAAGSAAADPIVISLNCTASASASAFALLQAMTANPVDVLLGHGSMVDVVNNILALPSACVTGLPI